MNDLLAQLDELWASSGSAFLAGLGAAGLVAALAGLAWVRATKKRLRPGLIWLAANLALLLNAEGMYEVLTQDVQLPKGFVWLVFAVFEIMLLNGEAQVAERYRATTTRDAAGKVVKAGEAGPMIQVVWTIAALSGVIVATNAGSLTEAILRLALPLLVVWTWWSTLTADGYTAARGAFAYSPRRLAERWGILIAESDAGLERIAHDRKVRRMVRLVDRIETSGWLAKRAAKKLRVEARTASDDVEADVIRQVERTRAIVARFVTTGQTGQDARGQDAGHVPAAPGSVPEDDRAEQTGQDARGQVFPGELTYWPAPSMTPRAYGPEVPDHIAAQRRELEEIARYAERRRAEQDAQNERASREAQRLQEEIARREAQEEREREERKRDDQDKVPPKSDEELLALYGDQLVRERGEKGELSVYRVRKVCGEGRILPERQGNRLHGLVLARYASSDLLASVGQDELDEDLDGLR